MRLIGANNSPILSGAGKLAGTRNYFFGRDRRNWHLGIPTFGTVNLSEVYPGVDMVYYGNQRSLEYDFVVKPGAKPAAIRFEFAGSTDRKLMPNGDLWMKTDSQPLLLHKPTVYQLENGKRKLIDGHYGIRSDGNVGIDVSSYDQSEPLVVDPVLEYATYLGGSGDDIESGATVDAQGNAYIVGTTSSLNFPLASTIGSASPSAAGIPFIAKLNASGTGLVYADYFGGSALDYVWGVAVDASGSAYVVGSTSSPDFPVTTSAFQTTHLSGAINAFLAKFNADGTSLVYPPFWVAAQKTRPWALPWTQIRMPI